MVNRGKKRYKSGSNIPEGPFADSKDYGRFIMQYLLRAAKESGDYDGVALASGKIKGENKTGFYTNIMIPQMKKISKKKEMKRIPFYLNILNGVLLSPFGYLGMIRDRPGNSS